MQKPYPSDLSDKQYAIVERLIPESRVGQPRARRTIIAGRVSSGREAG